MAKRYSLRKLRTGKLVLALVGSFIAVGAASTQQVPVHAQEQIQVQAQEQKVQLHYLTEAELTPEQKQALVQLDNSQKVEAGDTVYHYVFRPQVVANQLPSTGASDNLVGMIAGASLIVLAVAVSKSKKGRRIVSMTLFTLGAGGVLSSTAIAQEVFANLVEEVTVQVGEAVPTPKAIEGYQFTGYYIRENAPVQPGLPSEVEEPTTAEQPTVPVQPVTPVVPSTPEVPSTPVQPVSEKGDAAKEDKLPEAVVSSKETVEEIPFKEIVREDDQLDAGTEKVIQEGSNGYTKKRIDTITVDGQVVDTREVVVETKNATDKIIVKGTKVVTPVQPVSEKGDANKEDQLPVAIVTSTESVEEIPFKEIVREDNQLDAGTEKVIQEGSNGYTKKRVDTITVDGQVVDTREVVVETKAATDKIIVKGTKVVTPEQPVFEKGDATKEDKLPEAVVSSKETVEEIPFKEIVREDDQLEAGTEKVIQEGSNGYTKKRVDTITVDGQVVDTREVVVETKAATDKIIVKGTKVVTPEQPVFEKGDATKEDALPEAIVSSKEVTEEIDFNEVTREDDQLEVGTTKVIQEGEKGYTKKRIDTITVDGQVVDTREVVVETKDAIDKIIVKGTKVVTPTVDGHVIKVSKKYGSSNPENLTWEYVNSLPNSEKEKLTLVTPDYKEDPEARKEVVKLSRELFNYRAFNEAFLKLINAERESKGVKPLQLDENLIKIAQLRASEQADIAQSLRSNGRAHVRPDGTSYGTAYTEVANSEWLNSLSGMGENTLEVVKGSTNVGNMLDYDLIAQNMFSQWKASKGHYANMMKSGHTHVGLGVAQTLYSKTPDMMNRASTIGVQSFATIGDVDWDEE